MAKWQHSSARRHFVRQTAALALLPLCSGPVLAETSLTEIFAQRLKRILAAGELPYIDIESSCNAEQVDVDALARALDRCNIGLMALSSDLKRGKLQQGVFFDDFARQKLHAYADRFIPVGNGGQPPALTDFAQPFVAAQAVAAEQRQILMFGEYEFRHYPSPRQAKRGEQDRDINVPINGAAGHQLFQAAERTGLALQLHYEIEDALLAPLEAMLAQYPRATVIWCHLAQVRYSERATQYNANYVAQLLQRFPNLYFDTAMGDAQSVYPPSGQYHARIWARDGSLIPEWHDLIVAWPQRFLSALDLGQDRLDRVHEYDQRHRAFLNQLPDSVRHQVAYRNAWRLLFGREFG